MCSGRIKMEVAEEVNIKHEEPDSSERDAESPDDGAVASGAATTLTNGAIGDGEQDDEEEEEEELEVKHELIGEEGEESQVEAPEEDSLSMSPAASATSDADRQSGSGEDSGSNNGSRKNRRKRKVPVRFNYNTETAANANEEEEEIHQPVEDDGLDEPPLPKTMRQAAPLTLPQAGGSGSRSGTPSGNNKLPSTNPTPLKEYSVMTEERARNQAINSLPRNTCPICGDKANGLHYGIYTCEACKNFFKRSVVLDGSKAYICKFNNACNVNITEVDGVKMKGPRCQACRYQACLDAGMYHSGVQRTRGGRHGYSPVKQRSGSVEQKYPTIPPPNIAAVIAALPSASSSPVNNVCEKSTTPSATSSISRDEAFAAAIAHHQHLTNPTSDSLEPADVVSVSMSPPTSDHNDDDHQPEFNNRDLSSSSSIWENFAQENVRHEVEMLRSRTTIAETLLAEKTKQMDVMERQMALLQKHLLQADKMHREQAAIIDSLGRRLQHKNNNGNGIKTNGNGSILHNGKKSNNSSAVIERVHHSGKKSSRGQSSSGSGEQFSSRLPLMFENGGVTITPVAVTSSSPSSATLTSSSSTSSNLLQHLLRDGTSNSKSSLVAGLGSGDMATIEPIHK